MSAPANAWYRREALVDRRWWQVRCYFDDRFPDGHVVAPDHDPGDVGDTLEIWRTHVDDRGRIVVTVNDWAAPGARPCWYVSIVRPTADPPTASLVAYSTDHLPAGTVITNAEFFGLAVRNDAQIAAIRWWYDDACVEQVYVHPDERRHHTATKLIYAASAFHQANGWPGRLHSDGRRTDLGERLVAGLRHSDRIAPWTDHMAPMDPSA